MTKCIALGALIISLCTLSAPALAGSNFSSERELMDLLSEGRRNAHTLGLDHTLANKGQHDRGMLIDKPTFGEKFKM